MSKADISKMGGMKWFTPPSIETEEIEDLEEGLVESTPPTVEEIIEKAPNTPDKQKELPEYDGNMNSKDYLVKELKTVIYNAKLNNKPSIQLQAMRMLLDIEGIEKDKDKKPDAPMTNEELEAFIRANDANPTPGGVSNNKARNVYKTPRQNFENMGVFESLEDF